MAYVRAFNGVAPGGTTSNVLSATGFDRLLLVHATPITANTLIMWLNSSTASGSSIGAALSTSIALSSGTTYDLGPLFFSSTEALLGGLATSSGWLVIEELRV